MALALLYTFAARGISSIGSFIFIVALGRIFGTVGVGIFALAQSLIIAVAVLGRFGMNGALIRFVGRDLKSPKLCGYLWYACIRAAMISVFGMGLVLLLRYPCASLFKVPALAPVLAYIAFAIPPYVLAFILSGFMAAVGKPATACFLENGAIAFVATVLVLMLQWLMPNLGVVAVGIAYTLAAMLVCIWGFWRVLMWLRHHVVTEELVTAEEMAEFKRSSAAFFATDVASFLVSVLGVWFAGYWLPATTVGLYKASQQLCRLIAVVLQVLNLIISPRFSRLFHKGDLQRLGQLVRRSAALGVGLASLPLIACFVLPGMLLGIVGTEFVTGAFLLQILAVGQLFNLGCGSVGHVLNMSGNEYLSARIAWVSSILGLIIIGIGVPKIGIMAVAIGATIAITFRKLLGVYFVWRKIALWSMPTPNVLKWVGVGHATLTIAPENNRLD